MGLIAFLVIAAIFYVLVSLRVLKQYERGVVFLLGKFEGVRRIGLYFRASELTAADAPLSLG